MSSFRERKSYERKSTQIPSEIVRALDSEDATPSPSDAAERCHVTEENSFRVTGFAFPTFKKWAIISSIFVVQLSMNFNAAVIGNAIRGMSTEFNISVWTARLSQVVFLIMYAFGCEAWAPWSEELGRKCVLQLSLFLVNLCQIPCALARNFGLIIAFRVLGGLCSAGGSVTLGMVADMWTPTDQQYAVNFVVYSSVSGSVIGPTFGGLIQWYLGWRWVFWVSAIFGGVTQFIHFFVPETNTKILLDREAKRLRSSGEKPYAVGPLETKGASFRERLDAREVVRVMFRPYKLLITEPIVRWLSLFSGFSDSLIFTGLESFPLILDKWNFTTVQMGLSFGSLMVGYSLCWVMFQYIYIKDRATVRKNPNVHTPEHRLKALLFLGPLLPIGLLGLGFCSLGPPNVPWIAPLLFIMLIGIANYAIYQATIDYMIAGYGRYAASATGGNGFCRDFLAGIAALYSSRFYESIDVGSRWQLAYPTFILCAIGIALNIPVWYFYFRGEQLRRKSPYANQLEQERDGKRSETSPHGQVQLVNA